MRVVRRRGRSGLACAWVAAALLCARSASAQDAPADTTSPAANSDEAPQAQPEPAVDAAQGESDAASTEPPAGPAEETPARLSPDAAVNASENKLERELAGVRYEQEHSSLVLPWVVTVTGAALMLTGLIFGVHAVLSCPNDSCRSPWWPGWVVVGGSTIGMAGAVWLRLEYRELAELQSRRYQLERDLERSRINAAPLPSSANGPQAALRFRVAF